MKNLPKIKDGVYVINMDEYKSTGTHWIGLRVNGNNMGASIDAIYFDSFGVEDIPKEIQKFIGNKNIPTNIYRIQATNSIMFGYFCIGFIDFMLKGRNFLDYNNFSSPRKYK